MLSLLDRVRLSPDMPLRTAPAYRAQATAYIHGTGRALPLGSHDTVTPRLALRWLCGRGLDVAEQLDPPALVILAAWSNDHAEHDAALAAIVAGAAYEIEFTDTEARYVLSVQRLPCLPGAP